MISSQQFEVSTSNDRLDIGFIHQFLTNVYWAKGRSLQQVEQCIRHSLNFGLYLNQQQIGYARIVTDYVVFAYVLDVFVEERQRGQGYGTILMKSIVDHPQLASIKIWRLGTDDAHPLYTKVGFRVSRHPEKLMELIR